MKRINNKDEGYKLIALAAFLFLLFSTCYAEAAEYNASYTPGSITCISAGGTKTVSVTVKNTGTLTWNPGTTFLSYHWYQGDTCIVWNGEITYLPKSVAPNETITLNAKVTANVPAGSYALKWDMLGPTTWFSLKSPPVPTGNQAIEVKSKLATIEGLSKAIEKAGIEKAEIVPIPKLGKGDCIFIEFDINPSQQGDKLTITIKMANQLSTQISNLRLILVKNHFSIKEWKSINFGPHGLSQVSYQDTLPQPAQTSKYEAILTTDLINPLPEPNSILDRKQSEYTRGGTVTGHF